MMEQKNRFSALLEHLTALAEVKYYVLAQSVQFDVSYISKWISGRVLPTEKTASDTIQKLSRCLAENATTSGLQQLCQEYQLANPEELAHAMHDHLIDEYYYVLDVQQSSDRMVAPGVSYYPELSMKKFLDKMRHPVLRRVRDLRVMAAIDLFSMDNEYRMQIVNVNDDGSDKTVYNNVHFDLLVDVNPTGKNVVENALFLASLLLQMSRVNFSMYRSSFAKGKVVFAVKDDFAISGMLIRQDACVSVVSCENKENVAPIYNAIQSFCSRENLLFRRCGMREVLWEDMGYMHTLLSPNRCWMLNHATEHILPDDIFEELVEQSKDLLQDHSREVLCSTHELTKGIMRSGGVRTIFGNAAVSRFAISGVVDFFNHKMVLNCEQRAKVLTHCREMVRKSGTLHLQMIQGEILPHFQSRSLPTMFLSGAVSYLRLETQGRDDNLLLRINEHAMCQQFFDAVWHGQSNSTSDVDIIDRFFGHLLDGLNLMSEAGQ